MPNCQESPRQSFNSQINTSNLQQSKELHAKILELYSKIQAKSYQNLMIKKQNDEIKVQIRTLKELAQITNKAIQSQQKSESFLSETVNQKRCDDLHYSPCFQDRVKYTQQSQDQKAKKLNEKVDLLIKQNQSLQAQMEKIYLKISENQKSTAKNQWKNSDGRSTKFSNNITSIHQIWGVSQQKERKSKFSQKHNRHGSHLMSPTSIRNF